MFNTPNLGTRENIFIRKLTEEEIIEYVKGLFDLSVGILDPNGIHNRFNAMAWGTWNNTLATYDLDPHHVNVFFFYAQVGRIDIVRKEDMQEILDRYQDTKKALDEGAPEAAPE